MKNTVAIIVIALSAGGWIGCEGADAPGAAREDYPIEKSEQQWREELTPEQYRVLREKGTEPAGSGQYVHTDARGVYHCAACGQPLFASEAKYDSGSGWPSFYEPIEPSNVDTAPDRSLLQVRTEVLCSRCGSHLGHVFEDGPKPTGLRYCVNSVALELEPSD
jgi:peptide-methionine (R)-S-oxide reductase